MARIPFFIDFDHTLFKAAAFRALLFKAFSDAGYSEENVRATYAPRDPGFRYSPERQLENLGAVQPEADALRARLELRQIYVHCPSLVFEGGRELLGALDRSRYSPRILTLGNPAYQARKVEASGLLPLVDEAVYCQAEKWEFIGTLVGADERFLLVDDRNDAVAMTARAFPKSHGVLVDRTGAERTARYARLSVVRDLGEIPGLMLPAGFPPLTAASR